MPSFVEIAPPTVESRCATVPQSRELVNGTQSNKEVSKLIRFCVFKELKQ